MLAGRDLASLTLRESINLVAFTLIENTGGLAKDKLNEFFKGHITFYEFQHWIETQGVEPTGDENLDQPVAHNVTTMDLDQLEAAREEFNSGTDSNG